MKPDRDLLSKTLTRLQTGNLSIDGIERYL